MRCLPAALSRHMIGCWLLSDGDRELTADLFRSTVGTVAGFERCAAYAKPRIAELADNSPRVTLRPALIDVDDWADPF